MSIWEDRRFDRHINPNICNIYKILNAITDTTIELELKRFYSPYKKPGIITNFDGLFLVNSKPVIIDTKRHLTRDRIHFKLHQILQIHTILEDIHSCVLPLEGTTGEFRQMIEDYNIHTLPSDITILFAPNIIDPYIKEYIHSIYNGLITEDLYNYYCKQFLHAYVISSDILSDIFIPDNVKNILNRLLKNTAPTSVDFENLIETIRASSIPSTYKQGIFNTYTPYSQMLPALTYATGRIGIYYNDILDSPFGILPLSHLNHRGGVRRKILQARNM